MMKRISSGFFSLGLTLLLGACALNPQSADTDLNNTLPETKSTVYSDAIRKLGMMSVIYGRKPLNIMSKNISDNTGSSAATRAEIPRDITEIVKSTLNGVGGNVTFIPYDPEFLANSQNTGYSDFANKLIPDVIVSGGITEFDRGLVTKGDSFNIAAEIKGSLEGGFDFEDQNKGSLAQVTLDFNLIDFKTLAGIPRIQAVNGIKLHKSVKEDSFAFTVKSVTFGAKGTIKKVQGRHAGVRLLVELSMVQLVGRYQKLPYWRLLPGSSKDDVVIDQVISDFYAMSEAERISTMQSYLYLYGHAVQLTGVMDAATQAALQTFSGKHGLSSAGVNEQTFLALFENVPVNHLTKHKRNTMPAPTTVYAQAKPAYQQPATKIRVADTDYGAGQGSINLQLNKTDFNIGDQAVVSFTVDKPMFVRVVVINSKGEISTLFPNVYQSDNYCKPGITYRVPPADGSFALNIEGPAGTDKIRAVASETPIASGDLFFTSNGGFDEQKMAGFNIRAAVDMTIH